MKGEEHIYIYINVGAAFAELAYCHPRLEGMVLMSSTLNQHCWEKQDRNKQKTKSESQMNK